MKFPLPFLSYISSFFLSFFEDTTLYHVPIYFYLQKIPINKPLDLKKERKEKKIREMYDLRVIDSPEKSAQTTKINS